MEFTADSTALIVIDMQGDFCVKSEDTYLGRIGLSVANTREPIRSLQIVLRELRQREFAIIHTREGHRPSLADCPELKLWRSRMGGCELGTKGTGETCCSRALVRGEPSWDFISELPPLAGEDVVDGCGKGKFVATDLEMLLRQRGVTKLVFGGVTTSCCVATTMREAADAGFECYLLSDCTGDCSALDYMDTLFLARTRVLDAASFLHMVDSNLSADALPFPPLTSCADVFKVSANVATAMEDGGVADFASLVEKLGANAHACMEALRERAAADGDTLDVMLDKVRDGVCCSIVACDGGRTNAWPHKPEALAPRTTALLCIDLPDDVNNTETHGKEQGVDRRSKWVALLRKLLSSSAEAGLHIISVGDVGVNCVFDEAGEPTSLPNGRRLDIRKQRGAGAFSGTTLDATLRGLGVTNLLLVGDGANTSINTTMRQASDRGYDTLIVADGCGGAGLETLYGVTAATIRKAIFSACAHSDALFPWLDANAYWHGNLSAERVRAIDAQIGRSPTGKKRSRDESK